MRTYLEGAVISGAIPGAVARVVCDGRVLAHWTLGNAQVVPVVRAMQPDSVFDLASLTKVLAGTSVFLRLLEQGLWQLDDPVAWYAPAFAAPGKEAVTLRHLVTHTAGLAAWAPLYTHASDRAGVLGWICAQPLLAPPGQVMLYSDLGFALVGLLAERVTGEPFERLVQRLVLDPLELRDTWFNPPPAIWPRVVATERGNRWEARMAHEAGGQFADWRTDVLVGRVHDGNTFHALNGVSSHAGLFSTATDVARIAQVYVEGGVPLFQPASVTLATSDLTGGPGDALYEARQANARATPSTAALEPRGVGWELMPTDGSASFGDALSPSTFGHTGFTGTSLAIDPARGMVAVLLTNRVHPDADSDAIRAVRHTFYTLLAQALPLR